MKRIILAVAAIAGLGMTGFSASEAKASDFGIHFGGRGFHLDIGRVHHRPTYRSSRGHYDWHSTTHYDYHPPQVIRHGSHYHYQPGHYDLHRTGHWDYHRGSHHRSHGGHRSHYRRW